MKNVFNPLREEIMRIWKFVFLFFIVFIMVGIQNCHYTSDYSDKITDTLMEKPDSIKDMKETKHVTMEEEGYKRMEQTFKVGKAKSVDVDLTLDYGQFTIEGGTDYLVEGEFYFKDDTRKPVMNYQENEDKGVLALYMSKYEFKKEYHYDSDDKSYCNLKLNNSIPLHLKLRFGAGKGDFNFQGIKLNSVNMETGAGEFKINLANTSVPEIEMKAGVGDAEIDLTGNWENDLNADFTCGIGKIKFLLPKNVEMKIHTTGLLGEIKAKGFNKQGRDYYYTPDEKTDITFAIEITGAIGEIILALAD